MKCCCNSWALAHADFLCESILELVSSYRVAKVPESYLKVIYPLSVSIQGSGKKRLILDLRYVNSIFSSRNSNLRIGG